MTDVFIVIGGCLLVVIISTLHCQHSAVATECSILKVCKDFQIERVETNDTTNHEDWDNITDEITIGRRGHWEGIAPVLYQMNLNFSNGTHYTGSINITIKVVEDTDRIVINHNDSYSGIMYNSISLIQHCNAPSQDSNGGCISLVSFSIAYETLKLKLLNAKLRKGNVYVLSMDFYGRSKSTGGDSTGWFSWGLDDTSSASAFALSTGFQMRHAREVFPCFDHPRLKAKFQLCMEYPSYMMAASNTPTRGESKVNDDRKEECFMETPIMSTYLVAFALMENYTSKSVAVPGRNLTIELFAPISTIDEYRFVFNESIRTVEYMERVTKFAFPMPRLAYLVVYTKKESSLENFGLIRMFDKSTNIHAIIHETVHQWFGNLVTATDWRYLCLQEGLTTYYDYKIPHGFGHYAGLPRSMPYEQNHYIRYSRDENGLCYGGSASYFFYALDVWDGQDNLSVMSKTLLEKYAYKNAGLDEWNKAMDDAFANTREELRGYLKAWMTQPGPLSLLAWHTSPPLDRSDTNTTCIKVRQMIGTSAVPPRPVPVVLHTFSAHGVELAPSKLVLTKQDQVICDLQGSAFLINPNVYLPYYKRYGLKNYYHLMKGWHETFIGKYDAVWIEWFCVSFLRDELPLEQEPWGFSDEVLVDFMKAARLVVGKAIAKQFSLELNSIFFKCDCCLALNKSTVDNLRSCTNKQLPGSKDKIWNKECSGLRLVKQVFKHA